MERIELVDAVANPGLNPRPTALNFVEVWGVGWKVQQMTLGSFNQLSNASAFVERGIVHDHELPWSESWDKDELKPQLKDAAIAAALKGERSK